MKPDQERLSKQERRVVDRCARGVASQQEGEQLLAIFEVLTRELTEVERERDEAIEERDHARQKWTEWFKEAHDNVSEERELVRRLYDYACELENRYSHLGYPKAADLLTSESVPKSSSGEEAGGE